MDDGAEGEAGSGDTAVVPPGHNAWVVGINLVWLLTLQAQKNTLQVADELFNN
jgi:hypothetical protein